MAYITLENFKKRANIALTDTSQDPIISWLLTSFASSIDQYTNTTWSGVATNSSSQNFYGWGNGVFSRAIGFWQYINLSVSYGTLGQTPTLLVENQDYIVNLAQGTNNSVVNLITLINFPLTKFSFIQIKGSQFQSNLPSDLERALFFAVMTATTWHKYQGNGLILEDSIADVSTKFAIPDEYLKHAANLAAGDLMAVPAIASIIMKYAIQAGEWGRAF